MTSKDIRARRPSKEEGDNGDDEQAPMMSGAAVSEASQSSSAVTCSVVVAVAYGSASIVTTLANKALLSTWGFEEVFSLLFAQNLLIVVCLVPFADGHRAGTQPFGLADPKLAKSMLPVSVLCLANVWCGLSALRLSSVPVYQTLKRMSPLPAMGLDALLRNKRFSVPVRISVFTVCAGAFLAGCGDLDWSARGYAFAIASCVLQALYLVLSAKVTDGTTISTLCVAYYNALLSAPVLVLGMYTERAALQSFPHWTSGSFLGLLAVDLALGASLSLLLFVCTITNSATTTLIVGNMKAIVTTWLGFVLFGHVRLEPLGWLGIALNTAGGIMYSYFKHREARDKARNSRHIANITATPRA